MKIIYDVGAHDGEEIDYYLMKANKVVSIDANPGAINNIRSNFRQQLATGRLILIHCAIADLPGEITFYVNPKASGLSRRHVNANEIGPFGENSQEWEQVSVPARRLSDIIRDQGEPHFIKIDIEGAEEIALADLYKNDIRPQYISTEVGYDYFGPLCYIYLMGYKSFQLLNMNTLQSQFKHCLITLPSGDKVHYDFLWGSSGPFGEDLPEWWVDFQRLWFLIATRNLIFGDDPRHWYDVHARLS